MTAVDSRSRPPRLAVPARAVPAAALVAAACYSSFLLSPFTHPGLGAERGFVSELEATGQPYAWLYRTSDVLAGCCVLILALGLRKHLPARRQSMIGLALLGMSGLASILDGLTSMRCDPSTDASCARGEQTVHGLLGQLTAAHTVTGLLGFVGGAAGAIVLGAVLADRGQRRAALHIACGIAIAGCGLADVSLLLADHDPGTVERIRILLTSSWFALLGLVPFASCEPDRRQRP